MIFSEWYESTLSQATDFGLVGLTETMKNGEIGILFRNNHFLTITKQHDRVFTLVTDQGYIKSKEIVWEELTISGGGDFFNEDFQTKIETIKSDEELARELHNAEVERANQIARNQPRQNVPTRAQNDRNVEIHQEREQRRIQKSRSEKCDIQ
jgi:hypothetical protein